MMFKSAVATLIALIFVVENVSTRPQVDAGSNPLTICYSLHCPEGTVLCGKRSEVSSVDSSKLNVEIQCYDNNGQILKSKNTTEENPFGPNVYYKGTRLSGIITLYPFGESDVDQTSESNDVATSQPKSEVEDLNAK